jgi:hypothetical protein
MLKFGISAGICFEWVYGPAVNSLHSLGSASIRALLGGLVAWMVLEALQALWRTVMLLDDRPPRRIDPRPTVIGK